VNAERSLFEENHRRVLRRDSCSVAVVAGLLKLWLRSVPDPVLTFDLYQTFIAAVGSAGDDAAARVANVRTALRLLPPLHAQLAADLAAFLHGVAATHAAPAEATRALGAAFAGLLCRDAAPTLEGVLSDAPYAILLASVLIEHSASVFDAASSTDDALRFRTQMDQSFKRLRASMSTAYKAERAELRQKHSEREISQLMQRRADKVRTGTLDTSSLEAFERLAASMKGKTTSSATLSASQTSALASSSLTAAAAAAAAAADDAAAPAVASLRSSSSQKPSNELLRSAMSEKFDDDDDGDFGDVVMSSDDDSSGDSDVEESHDVDDDSTSELDDKPRRASELDDKPRRTASHQVGGAKTAAARFAKTSDEFGELPSLPVVSSSRAASAVSTDALPSVPVVAASVDWSSDDQSDEVAVTLLAEPKAASVRTSPMRPSVPAPAPSIKAPGPPPSLDATKKSSGSKDGKEKKHKKSSSASSSSSSSKGAKKTTKRDGSEKKAKKKSEERVAATPLNESSPKRLGRHVRTISSLSTAAPGKLSYAAGEEAVIVEQLSTAWAKARIGDRTGLIKLADVEAIDPVAGATPATAPTDAHDATPAGAAAGAATAAPAPDSPPVLTRGRSSSHSFDQQVATAIEVYDAARHEKAKRDYLRKRARASGVGIEDLAARGTNEAFLSTPLFFNAGDRIHLLSAPDDRPFWQGEVGGRIGHFLAVAVRRVNGSEAAASAAAASESTAVASLSSAGKPASDARRAALTKTVAGAIATQKSSGSGPSPLRKKLAQQSSAPVRVEESSDDQSSEEPAVSSLADPSPPKAKAGAATRPTLAQQAALFRSSPVLSASGAAANDVVFRSSPVLTSSSSTAADAARFSNSSSGEKSTDSELAQCAAALLRSVEQLMKKLPDSVVASAGAEVDALAACCRKTQSLLDAAGVSSASASASASASPSASGHTTPTFLSASASRVPDDQLRKQVQTGAMDDLAATRRSSGSAVTVRGSKASPTIGAPINVVHMAGAAPGMPAAQVTTAPGSPMLTSSPSRGRRSNTLVPTGDIMSPGKKTGRIGNFLSKFSSTRTGGPVKPTFGVPLRQLVESAVDIPEFVLRGGERLAKMALQEDVLLLTDVDPEQVQNLRDVIESGERVDYAVFRAHDITALLQQFLHELPEALLTNLPAFARCQSIDDEDVRDALLQSLMALAEPWRRALLEFLLVLQHRFERGFPTNTLENFVNVFAAALWHVQPPKLPEARALLSFMCKRREVLFGGGAGEKLLDNDAGMPTLSAATLDRLLLRLLDSNYAHVDPTFANVFFMCHDYFAPAIELAKRLIAMFERCAPKVTASMQKDGWRVELTSRALLMLHFWFTSAAASHLLADVKLLTLVRSFAQPIVTSPLFDAYDEDTQNAVSFLAQLAPPAAAGTTVTTTATTTTTVTTTTTSAAAAAAVDDQDLLCQRCRLAVGELKLATGKWTRPLCRLCAASLRELLDLKMQFLPAAQWHVFSAKDVADTITQIDFRQLRAIRPQEMLHKAFSDPKLSPNFAAMTASFNRYSQWVAGEVLKPNSPARRAAVIVLMVKIAQQLRRVYNFHAFFAFLSGLSFSSITRLAQTWAKVPKKYVARLEEFQEMMSMDGNFGGYQRLVAEAAAEGFTIIPLLVLLAKRLTAVEENNPTLVEDNLVNCAKLRMLHRQIDEVMSNQSEFGHDITSTEIPELRLFFLNLNPASEDVLHKRSLEVEARLPKKM
jgi:hypothetical protein